MAPTKSAGPASTMKQGKLSFASSKRHASATLAGKKNVRPASPATTTIKPTVPTTKKEQQTSRRASLESQATTTAEEEEDEVMLVSTSAEPMAKRQKVSVVPPSATVSNSSRASSESESESTTSHDDLNILENSGRLRKPFGVARHKMGNVQPLHSEGKTKAFHILRVFDTSYEYGPCVGVSRLDRWERAQMLGLNPPPEVRDILQTKQGIEDDMYKQSVFYGEVA